MKELKGAMEKNSDHEVLSVRKLIINGMLQLTDKYKNLKTHTAQPTALSDYGQISNLHASIIPW